MSRWASRFWKLLARAMLGREFNGDWASERERRSLEAVSVERMLVKIRMSSNECRISW